MPLPTEPGGSIPRPRELLDGTAACSGKSAASPGWSYTSIPYCLRFQ